MNFLKKKIAIHISFLSLITTISGCSMAEQTSSLNQRVVESSNKSILETVSKKSTVEVLYGVKISEGEIEFTVRSNGCTKKSHFKVLIGEAVDNQSELAIIRLKRDMCRMKSHLKTFTVTDSKISKASQFEVLNLLRVSL